MRTLAIKRKTLLMKGFMKIPLLDKVPHTISRTSVKIIMTEFVQPRCYFYS